METKIGRKVWAIAEGYIPSYSHGPEPQFTCHETACILNPNKKAANISIMIYFADRDPAGPYHIRVEGQRTLHLRFNSLENPEPVPFDTDYSSVFESDIPVVIQHTRLDSRQAENALISTMAFAGNE